MPRHSQIATVALALALAACRKRTIEAPDGTPYVKLGGLDPLPSTALAAAQPKPVFSALACDGLNVHGVSGVGVALTERVPGQSPKVRNVNVLPEKPSLAAVAVGRTSVVAVGAHGAIVRRSYGGDRRPLDDDTIWTPVPSPVTTDLNGVAALAEWIVAVGSGGTIVAQRSTDEHLAPWTRILSPTHEDLFAVSSCMFEPWQAEKLCVVGARGTLLVGEPTPSGIVFRSIATGTERTLRALTPGYVAPAHAVGDEGTIVAIDAKGAHLVPSGTTEDLLAVADGEIARRFRDARSMPAGGGWTSLSFDALIAVGKHGTVVVQARAGDTDNVAPFEQLHVPTADDLVAIVSDRAFRFIVAPRTGGLYTLALDIDCSHGRNSWCERSH